MSRLTNCRVFVALLSPAYVASAFEASHPTWVYDEMQCALIARDRMRLIGLVPPRELASEKVSTPAAPIEMPRIPAIIIQPMQETHFDEFYEAGNREALEGFLDSSLTYDGPRLTEAEQSWVKERLTRNDEVSLREIVERYTFISGAWRRLVVVLMRPRASVSGHGIRRMDGVVNGLVERLPFLTKHEFANVRAIAAVRSGRTQLIGGDKRLDSPIPSW